ncbi:ABC transporter-like protein [Catenovulum agarivorans DS-2]|uniref:ABC transporter-like protein n=1 Tax=Catenovulum agarivorans DS-2 TaxID=1328313 RepID=W7QC45_9ALTE|nr:ABC transporter ATP-binding protein/permease [Catenovulum agarivorans]EWH10444.1 ABC transporter-like protein [Catenovulum agarivorans DS-2]
MRPSHYNDFDNKTLNWQVVRQVWPYLTEFKLRIVLALLCLILAKVAGVTLPFVLKNIVDGLNTNNGVEGWAAVPLALLLAYGAVRLLNTIIGEVRDTLFGRVTERAMRRLGLAVFQHLHQLDIDFHLTRQTGGIARDIDRGTHGVSFLMRFMVFNIGPTLLEITFVVGLFFINYGWPFALIIVIAIVCYVGFSIWATDWRTEYVKAAAKADSSSSTRAIDSLLNYETVKYFNNEAYEAQRYDAALADWEVAKRKNRLSLFVLNAGQALVISTAMASMMILAAYQVSLNKMSIGDFVLVNAFMMQLFLPLNFLGFVYREIKGSLANIEHMFALLKRQPKTTDKAQAQPLVVAQANVEFNQVSFNYNQDRSILKDVSFTLEPGEKIAIVGHSGSGKSTLVKLLYRFYDLDSGQILIDGQNIADATLQSLRQSISIVPQDTVLFNDSLFNNIRYGRQDATEDEVVTAVELAALADFVASLPKGLETQVGERGLKLSGGEKQRVAIARAILKNAPILVFDEATSSLDSNAERTIMRAFNQYASGHSSIVIAHRLSTIVDADKIIVLDKGNLVEQGTHANLLAAKGHYYNLWQAQQQQQD